MSGKTALALGILVFAPGCHGAPRPDVVASTGDSAVEELRMDDDSLYFLERGDASSGKLTADGAVFSVPKGGGTPRALATGQLLADHIAIDDRDVYWSHSTGGGKDVVSRVPKKGGAPSDVVQSDSVETLAVDATSIYWASGQAGGKILKIAKAGGSPTELADHQSNPRGMVLDADSVYWLEGASDWTVRKVAKAGGPVTTLASLSRPFPQHLAVDGRYVYFSSGTLMRVPKGGGTASPVMEHVSDFGTDGESIYFTSTKDLYLSKLTPGASKPVAVLYDPGTFATSFDFDEGRIYFSALGERQIRSGKL